MRTRNQLTALLIAVTSAAGLAYTVTSAAALNTVPSTTEVQIKTPERAQRVSGDVELVAHLGNVPGANSIWFTIYKGQTPMFDLGSELIPGSNNDFRATWDSTEWPGLSAIVKASAAGPNGRIATGKTSIAVRIENPLLSVPDVVRANRTFAIGAKYLPKNHLARAFACWQSVETKAEIDEFCDFESSGTRGYTSTTLAMQYRVPLTADGHNIDHVALMAIDGEGNPLVVVSQEVLVNP